MQSLSKASAEQIQPGQRWQVAARLVFWLLGAGSVAWALAGHGFRDSAGFPVAGILVPLSIGAAGLVIGWAMATPYRRLAFWGGLALVGQAAMLQLIDAGPFMRYQHFKTIGRLFSEVPVFVLAVLAVQVLAVLVALPRRLPSAWARLRGRLQNWQLALLGLVFVLTSATVSHDLATYGLELLTASFFQALNMGTVVLAVLSIPRGALGQLEEKLSAFLGPAEESPAKRESPALDKFVLVAMLWVTAAAAVLSLVSYQRHPHIPDEVVYIYQANFLAQGKLAMPAPPVEAGYEIYLMQFDGARWFPSPPPGWPAILAVGAFFGVPWLVNPLLTGLNLLLAYVLLRHLYSQRLARLAVVLLSTSPWFVFMGMNFMTHAATLTCALAAGVGVERARRSGSAWPAWGAGMALGVLSLIRPLEGLILAVLMGLWSVGLGGRRLKSASLAGLVVGTAAVAALVLPYNRALTGDPLTFPINAYTDERFGVNSNAYGFGPDRGMGWPIDPNIGHTPFDSLVNANLNTFGINIELFGWSTGSILLAALAIVHLKYRRSDFLMMAVIAAIFSAFFFYYFSGGPDFGARYWYLMIVPLVALSARGIEILAGMAGAGHKALGPGAVRALLGIGLLCISAVLVYFPWRAIDKYHHYLQMRPDIRTLEKELGFDGALVMIQGDSQPDYASAAVYNPVDLSSGETLYVWDRNPDVRAALLEAYPDRPVWILEGPTRTGAGFEVVAGPTEPGTVPPGLAPHRAD